MRMTSELPNHAAACERVLDALADVAAMLIGAGIVPPFPHDVKGIRYRLEPEGEEDWKLPPGVIRDGWGDCEDLALWVVGGLRATGEDPGARCRIVRTGRNKLHCVVERSDGTFEDPSVELMTPEDLARYTG